MRKFILVWILSFLASFWYLRQAQAFSFTADVAAKKDAAVKPKPRIPVLQYHDDWVCVDKPPGVTVHRSSSVPRTTAVLTSLVKQQLSRKVLPVHRLDHRTSGVMLFAFGSHMAGVLHEAAIRRGTKHYIALVRGEWTSDEKLLVVEKPLLIGNVTKVASTRFTVLASTQEGGDDRCSLVLCEPLTGRTHQIRRHAASIGFPIIGDTQHGDSKVNRWWRTERGLDRLALHCWRIAFTLDSRHHECLAPLPLQWQAILKTMPEFWERVIVVEPRLTLEPYDYRGGSFGRYSRQKQQEKMQD